jgi:hypothetical protein
MVDPIKVGAGLSGTIASHKTLTLVVGMTMILDDFLRQLYHFSFYLYCVQTSNFATWSGLNFKTNIKVILFKRENLIKTIWWLSVTYKLAYMAIKFIWLQQTFSSNTAYMYNFILQFSQLDYFLPIDTSKVVPVRDVA